MKTTVILIGLRFCFTLLNTDATYAQKDEANLGKYSYYVEAIRNDSVLTSGTGFFIRNKLNKLFFVTNFHVASANNPFSLPHSSLFADRIRIKIGGASRRFYVPLELDSVLLTEETQSDIYYGKKPDLMIMHADIFDQAPYLSSLGINIIEQTSVNTHKAQNLFVFGFPGDKVVGGVPVLDSLQIISIGSKRKLDFFVKAKFGRPGFSGSPLFGMYEKDSVKLIGIVYAGTNKELLAIKYSEINKYLDRFN